MNQMYVSREEYDRVRMKYIVYSEFIGMFYANAKPISLNPDSIVAGAYYVFDFEGPIVVFVDKVNDGVVELSDGDGCMTVEEFAKWVLVGPIDSDVPA